MTKALRTIPDTGALPKHGSIMGISKIFNFGEIILQFLFFTFSTFSIESNVKGHAKSTWRIIVTENKSILD